MYRLNGIRVKGLAAAAALIIATTGCDSELKPNALPTLDDIVSSVRVINGASASGALQLSGPPAASGGPAATADGIGVAINGGSVPVTITSASSFDEVTIWSPGLGNHYVVSLPSAVSSVELALFISPSASEAESMPMRYSVRNTQGQLGSPGSHEFRILRVATGDVQVSVAWDSPTDIDLHVIDPSGEEVYYANTVAASGGVLDLDSNPACSIDGVNNENIVWPTGDAPAGTYKVILDYYDDCGAPESGWVITVQSKGQAPQVFSGRWSGLHGQYRDVEITTFTR